MNYMLKRQLCGYSVLSLDLLVTIYLFSVTARKF